jgi:hypothetical protein
VPRGQKDIGKIGRPSFASTSAKFSSIDDAEKPRSEQSLAVFIWPRCANLTADESPAKGRRRPNPAFQRGRDAAYFLTGGAMAALDMADNPHFGGQQMIPVRVMRAFTYSCCR